ncbi:MAG: fumarylacetoacetate hydrolase family protein [Myxococcota bacterium]|nr:fumarylacetoacetate hydrolase family protein [Myxococcota bacterium]
MRLASLLVDDQPVLAALVDGKYRNLSAADPSLGTDLSALLSSGADAMDRARAALGSAEVIPGSFRYRPVVPNPPAFYCLGLNDVDHAAEAKLPVPEFPVIFTRLPSTLIGHREPMLRPPESHMLDYEVELAVVIGTGGRRIPQERALEHVAGYTVFNDGSIRDWQVATHQWTIGKNFHGTGALGPDLVTPDELPPGAAGLKLATHVGDEQLQSGDTGAFVFDVARTIALLSVACELQAGDVIAMGTPSGIGFARKPPRYLVPGETCSVSIESIGVLDSPIVDEDVQAAAIIESLPLKSGGSK